MQREWYSSNILAEFTTRLYNIEEKYIFEAPRFIFNQKLNLIFIWSTWALEAIVVSFGNGWNMKYFAGSLCYLTGSLIHLAKSLLFGQHVVELI